MKDNESGSGLGRDTGLAGRERGVQTQREFFARADVKALQDICKRNHPRSEAHRKADAEISRLALLAGAPESEYGSGAVADTGLTVRRSGGVFRVQLRSVGNPDYRQDPEKPLYGVPTLWAHVDTLEEARAMVSGYMSYFELGSGNWAGGEVVRVADGLVIGFFSCNGRLWKSRDWNNRVEILIGGEA